MCPIYVLCVHNRFLCGRCELVRFEEGEEVIIQGQSHDNDSMYIIESGSVSVRERAVHCDTGIDMV